MDETGKHHVKSSSKHKARQGGCVNKVRYTFMEMSSNQHFV